MFAEFVFLPIRQTPQRGVRLFDPATAAKEETACVHGSRVTLNLFIEQAVA